MVLMVVLKVTLLPTWTDGFNGGIKSNYLPEQMVLMVVLTVTLLPTWTDGFNGGINSNSITYLNRWF